MISCVLNIVKMTRRLETIEVRELVNEELLARDKKIADLEEKLMKQDVLLEEHAKSLKEHARSLNLLESANVVQKMCNKYLIRSIDDQNQYQRRQNLIIDGLHIPKNANDDIIRDIVIRHFENIKVDIFNEDIVRAHRTGRPYRDKNGKMHSPILCRFISWWPRNIAWENRKLAKGVYLKADLMERRTALLENIQKSMKNDKRIGDVVEYIFADRNCRITAKSGDGRYFPVNTMEEFNLLVNYIESTLPPYDTIMQLLYDDGIAIYQKVENIINLNEVDDAAETLKKPNTKYIGREKGNIEAAKWQNPYSTSTYDLRTCLDMYREHVINTPDLVDDLESLRGCTLACWCLDGTLCHGQVLLDLLN